MGFKLIGNETMESGTFEPEETEIVRKILHEADLFINIGANIGYYCCIAIQDGKNVIAFEPIETNLHYLYKNIRANHWENKIEIYPIAVSDQTGIIEVFGGGTGASLIKGWAGQSEDNVRLVPTTTLDTVLASRLDRKKCFILADIEGGEDRMLRGAEYILGQNPKPIWLVEISISEHQPQGISINPNLLRTFKRFWDNGYEAWTADKRMRPITQMEIEKIVKGGPITIKTHNFLFMYGKEGVRLFYA
jgi:FkbM family methyltransferase